MAEDSGDKTEEPTPHKMQEARNKGQIAKSKEVTAGALLLLSYILFKNIGENSIKEIVYFFHAICTQVPEAANDFSFGLAAFYLLMGLKALAIALMPIMGVVFVGAFLVEAMQTGMVFSMEPLSPKIEKLNPLEGLKKMFSMQGFVELIKSLLKIGIVVYIAWLAIKEDINFIPLLFNSTPWDAINFAGALAYKIAIRVGTFYIIIAILDYMYKKWEYMKNLKMTKQEIKEEYKRLEGDPMVKQRMRDAARQAANQRMMGSVPQSDVVVTNPTHIAVALKYDQKEMKAPKLLAKGMRKHAEKIKAIAEEYNIPIIENEPLARSVYRTTKVGKDIPRELYQAIAEVLAYIYKKKREREARKTPKI